jgi:asparagine synthase (glutamine-hydrolysing)
VVVSPDQFMQALPKLIWHEDEPIAFQSSVPLFFVSRLARRHVKVVLTGEGADELFLGYDYRYRVTALNERIGRVYWTGVPRFLRRRITGSLPLLPVPIQRYACRTVLAYEPGPRGLFFDNFSVFPESLQRSLLLEGGTRGASDPYAEGLRYWEEHRGSLLERMSYADVATHLVELLMKQDQMSMAASIESRVPFLDHKLVEFVAGLPDDWKLAGLTTKRVLRESLKGLLPEQILKRPKMGFPVPFGPWMRSEWRAVAYDVLLDRRSRERGIVEPRAVERLLDDHAGGRTDGAARIWSLLNLELWHRTFIDKEGVQTLPSVHVQPAKPSATTARAPANAPALSGPISNITPVTK